MIPNGKSSQKFRLLNAEIAASAIRSRRELVKR